MVTEDIGCLATQNADDEFYYRLEQPIS